MARGYDRAYFSFLSIHPSLPVIGDLLELTLFSLHIRIPVQLGRNIPHIDGFVLPTQLPATS